jgi:hypothetical protein
LKEPSDALAARIQGDDFGKDGDLIQQCRMQRSSGPIVRRSQIENMMKENGLGAADDLGLRQELRQQEPSERFLGSFDKKSGKGYSAFS